MFHYLTKKLSDIYMVDKCYDLVMIMFAFREIKLSIFTGGDS